MQPIQQTPALLWGAFDFMGNGTESGDFKIECYASGTNFGDAEAVVESVGNASFFGEQVEITGYNNREFAIHIAVGANDGETHAKVEAVLDAQCAPGVRPPPLAWVPPIGYSAPCVFDVRVVQRARTYDDGHDLDEKLRGKRVWSLTFTCAPAVRSMDPIVVPAVATGPTDPEVEPETLQIDACASTAGWSIEPGGATLSVYSGAALRGQRSNIPVRGGIYLTRTGSVNMGDLPYLAINMVASITGGGRYYLECRVDGVILEPLRRVGTVYYYEPPTTFTTIRCSVIRSAGITTAPGGTIYVYDIAATNTLGPASNGRQTSRLTEVRGSFPTTATIRCTSASEAPIVGGALPDLLIHTSTNTAWQPDLRAKKVSSSLDAGAVNSYSGTTNSLDTPWVARMPADDLTDGGYALMVALALAPAGCTVAYEAKIVDADGDDTLDSDVVHTGTLTPTDGPGVYVIDDELLLPPVEVETGLGRRVEITLTGTSGGSGHAVLDEAWVFGQHDGVLTWIRREGAAVVNAVEVQSDDYGDRPTVKAGTNSVVESNIARHALAFNPHEFRPGQMQVFLAGLATDPLVELEYYLRFGYHVLGEASQ